MDYFEGADVKEEITALQARERESERIGKKRPEETEGLCSIPSHRKGWE